MVPDLRYMSDETHRIFDAIVIGGIYADRGMVGFANSFMIEQADHIHQYFISEAIALQEVQHAPNWWNRIKIWFYSLLVRLGS